MGSEGRVGYDWGNRALGSEELHAAFPPFHVDVVRQDNGAFAANFSAMLVMQNVATSAANSTPWLVYPAAAAAVAFMIFAISKFRKRLGSQTLTPDAGGRTVLVGAEHGFSRFEAPKWREDGESILVYGANVSWQLTPMPHDRETLRRILQTVIGPATLSRLTTRSSRLVVFGVVFAAVLAGVVTRAAPGQLLPDALFVAGLFICVGLGVAAIARR